MLREAEFAEMNMKYRQELRASESQLVDRDQTLRQLSQDVSRYKTQAEQVGIQCSVTL